MAAETLWEGGNNLKPTFLKYEKPLLTAMIQCHTPQECIEKIKRSIVAGADALGIQLCKLKVDYRTRENLTKIFDACDGKPIYVTSYHNHESKNLTEDDCVDLLMLALDCGATLLDIPGDLYDRSPQYELTANETAIKKQKALIDELHRRGGEVLMSSHTRKVISLEENLMIAKAHIERGADIIKIVNTAETDDEILTYISAMQKITSMTDKKLLLLSGGKGQITRYIGPNFGVCMYLCVESHGPLDTPEQPLISNLKLIRDNMKFDF